jgi:hypothetical protein
VAGIDGLVALFVAGAILDFVVKALRRRAAAGTRTLPERRVPAAETWRRVLDQDGPLGRGADRALEPGEEEDEEAVSLEVGPRVTSREAPVVRAPRDVVDLDDESRLAVARRMREAAARNRPHSRADHRNFDAKVREAEPAPVPERRAPTRAQMREAVKWREILDRPVGWRDEQ